MHSSIKVVLVGLVGGLVSVYGCGGAKPFVGGAAGNGVADGGIGGTGGVGMMTSDGDSADVAGQSTAGASGTGVGDGGSAGATAGGTAGAAGQSAGADGA